MSENWLIWGMAVLVIVIYCIGQVICTASIINWIERPLWKHFKNWDNNVEQLKKRVRNKDYQRDYYAYSCLSTEELKELRLLLTSRKSESSFIQVLLDLLWKLSLPIVAVMLGQAVLPPNHPFSAKLIELYLHIDNWLVWIAAAVAVFAGIVLLQYLFRSSRKKMINYHILLINQALANIAQ
jgi:hypothetical protein